MLVVLTKIDETLVWKKQNEAERDTALSNWADACAKCERASTGEWRDWRRSMTFWRGFPGIEKEGVLPDVDSRTPSSAAPRELKLAGWTKGSGIGELARRDQLHFDCATWLHKACDMRKEQFKHEARKGVDRSRHRTRRNHLVQSLLNLYNHQIQVVTPIEAPRR